MRREASMLERMELVLATNNSDKAREFARIFSGDCGVTTAAELGVPFHYEEGVESFLADALGKAFALFDKIERAVLADDSGLAVLALDGAPGVYSSRFGTEEGQEKLSADERNRYLLERMESVEDRSAFFVCCMVLVLDRQRLFVAQETLEGVITLTPSGLGGFGYDPLFYVPELGQTVAQLADDAKDRISHRGKAGRRLLAVIRDLAVAGT